MIKHPALSRWQALSHRAKRNAYRITAVFIFAAIVYVSYRYAVNFHIAYGERYYGDHCGEACFTSTDFPVIYMQTLMMVLTLVLGMAFAASIVGVIVRRYHPMKRADWMFVLWMSGPLFILIVILQSIAYALFFG